MQYSIHTLIILNKLNHFSLLLLKVVKEVIVAAHDIGLYVRVCVSDMGAANQDLWKHVGIASTRTSLQNSIPHPCFDSNSTHCLYFMANVPHLLKSIRNCLLTQSIILPDFVMADANLQSNVVNERQVPLSDFPSCHNIVQSVVTRYFRLRLHVHAAHITNKLAASQSAIQHASKSAHCRTKVT